MSIEIKIRDDGPILVTGEDIVLLDAEGGRIDLAGKTNIALCRCGQSQKKPFCDGTHKTIGFHSRIRAGEL